MHVARIRESFPTNPILLAMMKADLANKQNNCDEDNEDDAPLTYADFVKVCELRGLQGVF